MSTDDNPNNSQEEKDGEENKAPKKKSLMRKISNLFLYLFITFVTLFLVVVIGLHTLLKYYPDQIIGVGLKESIARGTKNKYAFDYENIDVKLISGWSIHDFLSSGSITLHNATFIADSAFIAYNDSVPVGEKKNLAEVKAKTVSLQNFSILRALFQEEIYIGNIFIDSANVGIHKYKIKGQVNEDQINKKSLNETLSTLFVNNKEFLKRYRIGNINTVNTSFNYFDHTQKITQQIALDELTTSFQDIYLDSTTLEQPLLPIHLGECSFSSNNIRLELKNSPIGLSFRKLSFSTHDSSILIFNTSAYRINENIENVTPVNNATIPLLSLEGIDFNRLLYDSSIIIKRVSIVKPEVELDLNKKNKVAKKPKKKPQLPPFLKEINIKEFNLESAKIPFESEKLGKRRVNDLTFNLIDIYVTNETLEKKIPIDFDYFDVKLKQQRWKLNNQHYIRVGGLYYNSKWKNLSIYHPSYQPTIEIPDSTSQMYVKAKAKKVSIKKVDYNFFLKKPLDSLWVYNDFIIEEPKTEIWLPTHPIKKEKKEKKKSNITIALRNTEINNGNFKLHLPRSDEKLTVQDIDIKLDSLTLPLGNPKYFELGHGLVNLNDIHVPRIKDYDILLENMKFDTHDSTLVLDGININTAQNSKSVEVNSYVKNIVISDLGWRNYLLTDSLIVRRIFVDIPSSDVEIPVKEAISQVQKIHSDSIKIDKPKKKPPFKYLLVQDFHLRKGPLSITKEDIGLLGRSESIGIDIEDFTLQNNDFDWKDIYFVMEDIYVPIHSISHKALVDKISLNVEKQRLGIQSISVTPDDEKVELPVKSLTGANNIDFYGLDIRMLKDIHQLNIDSINFKGLRGVLAIDEQLNKGDKKVKQKVKSDGKEFLKHLDIGKIHLGVDDFALLHMDKEGKESYLTFFGGDFTVEDLASEPSDEKQIGSIKPENVNIRMKGLQFERDISPYVISTNDLVVDTKGDSIVLTDANIVPKLGFQSVGIIDSLFLLQVDQLKVKGAGIKPLIYDKKIDIDTIYAKNINYINPAKAKKKEKVKKEGNFAEKSFPKEQVEKLLEKFESIAVHYIQVDNSAVSFRSKYTKKKRQNISRLMRRKRTDTPLSSSQLSTKELNKFSKKTYKIQKSKRFSKERKEELINEILAESKGNPIDTYTLFATEDSSESIEHKRSFLSVYNENTIKEINLTVDGIYINQETVKSDTNYVVLGDINLNLGKNIYNLNNGMYAIGFDSLDFNSRYADLHLKSFQLIPRYSKKLFGIANEFQTDRIEIDVNDVLLRGFHFKNFFFNDKIHINGLEVDRLDLSAYRDKTVPIDPNKKDPKMIHTILESIPLALHLDTVTITDSHIDYEEYKGNIRPNKDNKELEGKSGQFQLNDFTGQIFNITNDTSKLAKHPYMEMYVQGTLMDKGGHLKMYFRWPPLDSLGTYYYEGEVGEMDLVKLNPLVERLELVKIKDGHLKRMYFKILADDKIAVGNMQFRYKNLEVDVLKDKAKKTGELKRRAFLSSVANVLIREENPRFPSMKQGHIYFERDTTKFIFNFWVKSVLTGIASTLSPLMEPNIPKKDKETKMEIRYIEKNTKRKNRLKGPLSKIN